METFLSWFIGLLVVSSGIGHFVTEWFNNWVDERIGPSDKPGALGRKFLSPALTGCLERLFFTLAVAFGMPGAIVAMIGWLAVKMANGWQRRGPEENDEDFEKTLAFGFGALLAGLVSMMFALVGGVICRGHWWGALGIAL